MSASDSSGNDTAAVTTAPVVASTTLPLDTPAPKKPYEAKDYFLAFLNIEALFFMSMAVFLSTIFFYYISIPLRTQPQLKMVAIPMLVIGILYYFSISIPLLVNGIIEPHVVLINLGALIGIAVNIYIFITNGGKNSSSVAVLPTPMQQVVQAGGRLLRRLLK